MFGVIFDMDGLMIDSERIIFKALCAAGKEMGLENIEQPLTMSIGINKGDTEKVFRSFYGADFDFERFYKLKYKYLNELVGDKGFPPKKGIIEILDYLTNRNIPIAVCSSTREGAVMDSLEKIGAKDYFRVFVCGDMGLKGKPAPDMFLKCSELMKLSPRDCYVLEDSRNGIKAAYAAGMRPIMIPDMIEPDDEIISMLYALKKDLTEVIAFLEAECE
ncbi:MAG: HAD family phosphatase [Oscillospiraceae bacterium]|nr:HAD family phosphatase [Oscillospiraceae bacterium]